MATWPVPVEPGENDAREIERRVQNYCPVAAFPEGLVPGSMRGRVKEANIEHRKQKPADQPASEDDVGGSNGCRAGGHSFFPQCGHEGNGRSQLILIAGTRSEVDLRNWLHEVILDKNKNPAPKEVLHYLSLVPGAGNRTAEQTAELFSGKAGDTIMDSFWITSASGRLPLVYDFAWKTANEVRVAWRRSVTILYAAGCICLVAVEAYNVWSAWKYWRS